MTSGYTVSNVFVPNPGTQLRTGAYARLRPSTPHGSFLWFSSGRDDFKSQMAAKCTDLIEAVAINQRNMVAHFQLFLEKVIAVLHAEEYALGAGVVAKAYAADDLALRNKQLEQSGEIRHIVIVWPASRLKS